MPTNIKATTACLHCVATMLALYFLPAKAQEPNIDKAASIIGAWTAEDTHLSLGALYQPTHGTRQRRSTVYFELKDNKLTGHSFTPYFKEIVSQKGWNGRTQFASIKFVGDKLVFEIDSKEVRHGWAGTQKGQATIRVEAQLRGERLVGKWGLFLKDGSEPFRGEWEAGREKDSKQK